MAEDTAYAARMKKEAAADECITTLPMPDSPWHSNDDGLWCPACGEHIAAPWNMGDDYKPPESCKTCGYPDFEDGPGYFTDDD